MWGVATESLPSWRLVLYGGRAKWLRGWIARAIRPFRSYTVFQNSPAPVTKSPGLAGQSSIARPPRTETATLIRRALAEAI